MVPIKKRIKIELVDITGRKILTFIDSDYEQGNYSEFFNVSSLNSGYYFVKAKIGGELFTNSIIKQ